MQEMLDTVRATGAKNVVVAGGLEWAYDFSGILDGRQLKDPGGNGVIYANHAYDNKRESVFTWIADMEKATAVFPVIISEFGGSGGPDRRRGWWGQSPATAMGDDWLLHVLQAIQDHNWSFTAWDLHPTAGPTLIEDWNYMPTPDFGVFVKKLLVEGKLPRYTPPDLAKLAKESATALPETARLGGSELYGDWNIEPDPCERRGTILAFSGGDEGKLVGQWINFRGLTELEDVRFKDNKVSFSQTVRFGGDEYKANFSGTIKGDRLSGAFSHGGIKDEIKAERSREMPPVVGTWEMKFKPGWLETAATLVVKADKKGRMTGEWQGQKGESEITDVNYEGGKLTFRKISNIEGRLQESTFEGRVRKETGTLSGTFRSGGRNIEAAGLRIGSTLIGNWNLDVTSERGSTKQRLKVNPDMSGMYGMSPIEKVNLEGNKVSFKIVLEFRQRTFEMNFEGKLEGPRIVGEISAFRGTQKVVGKKASRI
ncbi:MAG: cellulase family glycosylhydrolase [Planctomycetota bacterium]